MAETRTVNTISAMIGPESYFWCGEVPETWEV